MHRLTLAERVEHFKLTFPKHPASWPWPVQEKGRPVYYAVWLGGGDYTNKTRYHGAYPHGLLERLLAFFPDIAPAQTLHAFAGSVPTSRGLRLDLNPATNPDILGSVYDAVTLVGDRRFRLVCADPPYTAADNAKYGQQGGINSGRAMRALAAVTVPRGFCAWLDTRAPIYSGQQWRIVLRIYLDRSTGHAIRRLAIFERLREATSGFASSRDRGKPADQAVSDSSARPLPATLNAQASRSDRSRRPNTTADGAPACAFGEPIGPGTAHPLCEAETDRACRAFDEAVARGEYDAAGYTPAERRAQAKRLAS